MTVAVLGSANLDLVYRVDRLPDGGETVLATDMAQHPGGKGNNQAIAAARSGAQTRFVAAVGRDSNGDTLVAALELAGIEAIVRRLAVPTGTAMITVDSTGENSIVVSQGANAQLGTPVAEERAAIENADFLLLQLEIPIETVIAAAAIARAAGTTVVLNAAPIRKLPTDLLTLIDLLIVNEHEALILAAQIAPELSLPSTVSIDGSRDIAAILLHAVPSAVITLGGAGAAVLSREMSDGPAAHVPAAQVTAIDTTGAGDTFCGALVAELDAGTELIAACAFASAAAGLAVQKNGAVPSIPERAAVMDALTQLPFSAP